MAAELETLDIRSGPKWRSWLRKHHAANSGVWLVFHKDHTGVPSVPYEDAVRHALCFGWIDSLIKRLDEDRYARKFTPRKHTSKWSDINRKRWAELEEGGLLEASGLAAAPTGNRYASRPATPELPAYIAKSLRRIRRRGGSFRAWRRRTGVISWSGFTSPNERKRGRNGFANRSISLLAAGKKLGLK